MTKPFISNLFLGFAMLMSSVLATLLKPSIIEPSQQQKFYLESIIPADFDDWKIDPSSAITLVRPDVKGFINKIYNQELNRTYINKRGDRVMLAIAYGSDQRTDLHVHRPELCYVSSGFEIGKMTKAFVETTIGQIPVMHLVARQGIRNEPITYWIRVGSSLTRGWFEQKIAAFRYGISGTIPDGLLFRLSTISNNDQDSYRIQKAFLVSLLKAVRSEDRYWLVGQLAN